MQLLAEKNINRIDRAIQNNRCTNCLSTEMFYSKSKENCDKYVPFVTRLMRL